MINLLDNIKKFINPLVPIEYNFSLIPLKGKEVSLDFKEKVKDKDLSTEYGAAIAYTHIKQLTKAINECNDYDCVTLKIDDFSANETIGFKKFENHTAFLEMNIIKH